MKNQYFVKSRFCKIKILRVFKEAPFVKKMESVGCSVPRVHWRKAMNSWVWLITDWKQNIKVKMSIWQYIKTSSPAKERENWRSDSGLNYRNSSAPEKVDFLATESPEYLLCQIWRPYCAGIMGVTVGHQSQISKNPCNPSFPWTL